jgi:hypothetical protein
MDRTRQDLVPLTHGQLAAMLGVARSYTSRVLQAFKAEGALATQHGGIMVRDRAALEALACLCDDAVETHSEKVLPGVYPTRDATND